MVLVKKITHLEINLAELPNKREKAHFSYRLLNHRNAPGNMLFCGSTAMATSIAGQIAAKVSVQHFIETVMESSSSQDFDSGLSDNDNTLSMLETAFRHANRSVFGFANNLQAGDRLGASLLTLLIQDGILAFGRAGEGSALLVRGGKVFPFFARPEGDSSKNFLGAHSSITVDLAAVPLEASDRIVLFPNELDESDCSWLLNQEDLRGGSDFFPPSVSAFGLEIRVGERGFFLDNYSNEMRL